MNYNNGKVVKERRKKDMARGGHMSTMLTTREVARLLNVHINTIRRWSSQGIIRAYRIGPRGDRRFWKEDINGFLREPKINRWNGNKGASMRR